MHASIHTLTFGTPSVQIRKSRKKVIYRVMVRLHPNASNKNVNQLALNSNSSNNFRRLYLLKTKLITI